jgi:hypothetical protein
MANFESLKQARERIRDSRPLAEEELRALFPWFGELAGYTGFSERVVIDVAFQQIAAINQFNKASGRLTKISIIASCLQVLVAAVALWIASRYR